MHLRKVKRNLMETAKLLTSGGAAKEIGVTRPAVTNLEKELGLTPMRDSAGRKLYTESQVAALKSFREARRASKATRAK
jgi:DNA-binding transcriptional MerR regulator